MYRRAWYPESSYAIEAKLKEVDRQWIAQELIFYSINMPSIAVQFDNIGVCPGESVQFFKKQN